MNQIYLNDWAEDGFHQMVFDFEGCYLSVSEYQSGQYQKYNQDTAQRMKVALASDKWAKIEVLLASYVYEDYNGEAFVLLRQDGKLMEVHGSHCSCYGLEDQWEPEEATIESIRHRLDSGRLGVGYGKENVFAIELRQAIDDLVSRG